MFNWLAFFAYTCVSVFTPGPNNLLSLSNSSKVGFKKNVVLSLGMFTGIFVIVAVCAAFSEILYEFIPNVKLYLQIICCLYLAWLIVKLWLPKKSGETQNRGNGYFTGVLLQLINVKLYIFAFSVMSVYILPFFTDIWILAAFSLGIALICLVSISCWGLFGAAFKKVFDAHPIITNVILSLLLLYCAVSIFL